MDGRYRWATSSRDLELEKMGQDQRDNKELQEKLKHYRLNESEHRRIAGLLGREPQGVEWALFSAMWS